MPPATPGERFTTLRAELDRVAAEAGRDPRAIGILGVAKYQPLEAVRDAVAAGLRDVGENYLQEAREKYPPGSLPGVRRHFIGHVQTNKAKAIAAAFDVVQSVDREDAARALAKAAAARETPLGVLIQVNISPAERFGAAPDQVERLAEIVRGFETLRLEGVMAIGPVTGDPGEIDRAFATARRVFERVGGTALSLGMSGDWPRAVAAGSTMIRAGTAIFGPRPRKGDFAPAPSKQELHLSEGGIR